VFFSAPPIRRNVAIRPAECAPSLTALFHTRGNSMKTTLFQAASLGIAALTLCACAGVTPAQAPPAPEPIQDVVITASPVAELGVPRPLVMATTDEIKYESILNVDDLVGGDGAYRWPSTAWILYPP
jgi:hypothetical protein